VVPYRTAALGRGLAVVSDEAVQDRCTDSPKLVWLVDIRDEANPIIVGTAPLPDNVASLCGTGGLYILRYTGKAPFD
jgi:hypothetical protein